MRSCYLVGTPAGVEHFIEVHELGLFSPEGFAQAFGAANLSLRLRSGRSDGRGHVFWSQGLIRSRLRWLFASN